MNEQERARLTTQGEQLDDQFSPLDLSGFPQFNKLPAADFYDDRFSKRYGDTPLSRNAGDLKAFLRKPDPEALMRAGLESGDPTLLEEVADIQGLEVVRQFKAQCDDYIPTNANYENVVSVLAANLLGNDDLTPDEAVEELERRGQWTVENLASAWQSLKNAGLAELPAGTARALTEAEKLEVSRLAQAGRGDAAIEKYVEYATGETPSVEMLADPAYRQACDQAVWYTFMVGTPDFAYTAERAAFIDHYCGSRPLTIHLLQHAWSACQKKEAQYARDQALGFTHRPETPPTPQDLDSLDDGQLANLYHNTLGEYVKSASRSTGMLA
jgi:hypothetical protein